MWTSNSSTIAARMSVPYFMCCEATGENAHLHVDIHLRVQLVEETLLCSEGPNGDHAIQHLSEVCKDEAARVTLHAPQMATCPQETDREVVVGYPEDGAREDERRDYAAAGVSVVQSS